MDAASRALKALHGSRLPSVQHHSTSYFSRNYHSDFFSSLASPAVSSSTSLSLSHHHSFSTLFYIHTFHYTCSHAHMRYADIECSSLDYSLPFFTPTYHHVREHSAKPHSTGQHFCVSADRVPCSLSYQCLFNVTSSCQYGSSISVGPGFRILQTRFSLPDSFLTHVRHHDSGRQDAMSQGSEANS